MDQRVGVKSVIKYVLVSQGIKIFETYDKQEAERIKEAENTRYYEYYQKCLDSGEEFADNEVFLYEEGVNNV